MKLSHSRVHVAGGTAYCVHHHVSPKSEIVLNVTIACNDISLERASLLDFVEKLIHRFVEDKKRLRVT